MEEYKLLEKALKRSEDNLLSETEHLCSIEVQQEYFTDTRSPSLTQFNEQSRFFSSPKKATIEKTTLLMAKTSIKTNFKELASLPEQTHWDYLFKVQIIGF